MVVSCPYTHEPRAKQAGDVALELGISREMQDQWAYRSQMLYQDAFKAGLCGNGENQAGEQGAQVAATGQDQHAARAGTAERHADTKY